MRAEVEAVASADEGEAVGSGVARILEVVLAEFLRRGHVEGAGVDVCDLPNGIVEDLAAGVGRQKLVSFRQLQAADKGILELADDGVRLVVLYACPEADQGPFGPDLEAQVEGFSADAPVVEADGVAVTGHEGRLIRAADFDFLLLGRVVVKAPEWGAAGVVPPVEGEFPEASALIDDDLGALQFPAVFEDEAAELVIEGTIFREGGRRQLGQGVRAAVEGDGAASHEARVTILPHVMPDTVLQGGYIRGREGQTAEAVRPLDVRSHLGGNGGVLELQFHAHVRFLDGGHRPGEGMLLAGFVVPVPVRLHPGLVNAELFPVLVARSHIIRYPVESLSAGMAALRERRDDLLETFVAAVDVDVPGEVDFLGGDVESGELDVLAAERCKTGPHLVHIPVERLQLVFGFGEIKSVSPIDGGGGLVGKALELDRVGKADDDLPLLCRRADSTGHLRAGLVEGPDAAVAAEPEVYLVLPFGLGGGLPVGGNDKRPVVDPVGAFQKEKALEEPVLAAVRGLPAYMGGEAGGVPGMRFAVPVADKVNVAQLPRRGAGGKRQEGKQENPGKGCPVQDLADLRYS